MIKKIYFKIKRKSLNFLIHNFSSLYRPPSNPYISGDTFRKLANHIFDETKKLSSASIDDSNVAKRKGGKADSKNAHAQEEKEDDEILEANLVKLWEGKDELGAMKALEDALRPIDRYALGFRQDVEPIWNNVAADAWRQEVLMEASNRELEIEEIEAERLKEEVLLEKSVEMVRAKLARLVDLGVNHLLLNPVDEFEEQLELCAQALGLESP